MWRLLVLSIIFIVKVNADAQLRAATPIPDHVDVGDRRPHKGLGHNESLFTTDGLGDATLASGCAVVSNAQIVMVRYGPGTLMPEIQGGQFAAFYAAFLNSKYFTWYTEYNPSTTKQTIGKGTVFQPTKLFGLQQTTTPVGVSTVAGLLKSKILDPSSGFPFPTLDSKGFVNTIYIIHFQAGITVTSSNGNDEGSSCAAGGFCGLHGLMTIPITFNGVQTNKKVPYIIFPDHSEASGCFFLCGSGSTAFQNAQSTLSHELYETVASCWHTTGNPTGNELADRCESVDENFTSALDHQSYVVQRSYSNSKNNCIGSYNSLFGLYGPLSSHQTEIGSSDTLTYFVNAYASSNFPTVQMSLEGNPHPVNWVPHWFIGGSQTESDTITPADFMAAPNHNVTVKLVFSLTTKSQATKYKNLFTVRATYLGTPATNARFRLVEAITNLRNGFFKTDIHAWTITAGQGSWQQNGNSGLFILDTPTGVAGTATAQQDFFVNAPRFQAFGIVNCNAVVKSPLLGIRFGIYSGGSAIDEISVSCDDQGRLVPLTVNIGSFVNQKLSVILRVTSNNIDFGNGPQLVTVSGAFTRIINNFFAQ